MCEAVRLPREFFTSDGFMQLLTTRTTTSEAATGDDSGDGRPVRTNRSS